MNPLRHAHGNASLTYPLRRARSMPTFRTRKLRTAVLAIVSTGVIAGGSVVAAQIANAQAAAPPRPPCPAIEPLVPGENNYIVGNPDNIQVIGGVASWDEIRNV